MVSLFFVIWYEWIDIITIFVLLRFFIFNRQTSEQGEPRVAYADSFVFQNPNKRFVRLRVLSLNVDDTFPGRKDDCTHHGRNIVGVSFAGAKRNVLRILLLLNRGGVSLRAYEFVRRRVTRISCLLLFAVDYADLSSITLFFYFLNRNHFKRFLHSFDSSKLTRRMWLDWFSFSLGSRITIIFLYEMSHYR